MRSRVFTTLRDATVFMDKEDADGAAGLIVTARDRCRQDGSITKEYVVGTIEQFIEWQEHTTYNCGDNKQQLSEQLTAYGMMQGSEKRNCVGCLPFDIDVDTKENQNTFLTRDNVLKHSLRNIHAGWAALRVEEPSLPPKLNIAFIMDCCRPGKISYHIYAIPCTDDETPCVFKDVGTLVRVVYALLGRIDQRIDAKEEGTEYLICTKKIKDGRIVTCCVIDSAPYKKYGQFRQAFNTKYGRPAHGCLIDASNAIFQLDGMDQLRPMIDSTSDNLTGILQIGLLCVKRQDVEDCGWPIVVYDTPVELSMFMSGGIARFSSHKTLEVGYNDVVVPPSGSKVYRPKNGRRIVTVSDLEDCVELNDLLTPFAMENRSGDGRKTDDANFAWFRTFPNGSAQKTYFIVPDDEIPHVLDAQARLSSSETLTSGLDAILSTKHLVTPGICMVLDVDVHPDFPEEIAKDNSLLIAAIVTVVKKYFNIDNATVLIVGHKIGNNVHVYVPQVKVMYDVLTQLWTVIQEAWQQLLQDVGYDASVAALAKLDPTRSVQVIYTTSRKGKGMSDLKTVARGTGDIRDASSLSEAEQIKYAMQCFPQCVLVPGHESTGISEAMHAQLNLDAPVTVKETSTNRLIYEADCSMRITDQEQQHVIDGVNNATVDVVGWKPLTLKSVTVRPSKVVGGFVIKFREGLGETPCIHKTNAAVEQITSNQLARNPNLQVTPESILCELRDGPKCHTNRKMTITAAPQKDTHEPLIGFSCPFGCMKRVLVLPCTDTALPLFAMMRAAHERVVENEVETAALDDLFGCDDGNEIDVADSNAMDVCDSPFVSPYVSGEENCSDDDVEDVTSPSSSLSSSPMPPRKLLKRPHKIPQQDGCENDSRSLLTQQSSHGIDSDGEPRMQQGRRKLTLRRRILDSDSDSDEESDQIAIAKPKPKPEISSRYMDIDAGLSDCGGSVSGDESDDNLNEYEEDDSEHEEGLVPSQEVFADIASFWISLGRTIFTHVDEAFVNTLIYFMLAINSLIEEGSHDSDIKALLFNKDTRDMMWSLINICKIIKSEESIPGARLPNISSNDLAQSLMTTAPTLAFAELFGEQTSGFSPFVIESVTYLHKYGGATIELPSIVTPTPISIGESSKSTTQFWNELCSRLSDKTNGFDDCSWISQLIKQQARITEFLTSSKRNKYVRLTTVCNSLFVKLREYYPCVDPAKADDWRKETNADVIKRSDKRRAEIEERFPSVESKKAKNSASAAPQTSTIQTKGIASFFTTKPKQ